MSQSNKTFFTCPVCLGKAIMTFRKPTFFKNAKVQHECKKCECDFEVTISKPRGAKPAQLVDITVRITAISDLALAKYDGEGHMAKALEDLKTGPLYANHVEQASP